MTMPEASRPAELFQLDRPTCLALLTTQHVGPLIIDAAVTMIRLVNSTAFESVEIGTDVIELAVIPAAAVRLLQRQQRDPVGDGERLHVTTELVADLLDDRQ